MWWLFFFISMSSALALYISNPFTRYSVIRPDLPPKHTCPCQGFPYRYNLTLHLRLLGGKSFEAIQNGTIKMAKRYQDMVVIFVLMLGTHFSISVRKIYHLPTQENKGQYFLIRHTRMLGFWNALFLAFRSLGSALVMHLTLRNKKAIAPSALAGKVNILLSH